MWLTLLIGVFLICPISAYNYDSQWVQYNLNTNQDAKSPLDYAGEWVDHNFTKSPDNWRFPFYTLFLDRFVNGDPTNDNINGTLFEHDLTSNQMRNGGDLQGLIDSLDYLAGMGIKGLYIAGSPFMNQPWTYDSYSPIDLTILDWHFGNIDLWRTAIQEIHSRGMYVILDNTFATMGDLIGFEGYMNESAPFEASEHGAVWKSDRHYWDFDLSQDYNETCTYPRFWLETGFPVGSDVMDQFKGCHAGEFDQYGDTEAFGVYPDWRRQLTKFASVQDRLRDWHEPTRLKIQNFYCIMIGQLDIDGYRYDKAMQATVDALSEMNAAMRQCARKYGKENFFLPGEITGGNVAGSIFLGRGRQPDMKPESLSVAVALGNDSSSSDQYFIRGPGLEAVDAGAFHYTTYRTLTRFLGMDGNLAAGYDSPLNWVDQWNDFLLSNDMVNANTGLFDPRHMYGVTNQDVFRWPSINQGLERQLLGHFITTLLMPGIPLLLWGEEQAFYMLDNTAINYIFGRQPMSAATAWMHHGCYSFPNPSSQYYDMPMTKARDGCHDESQMNDHRDPTSWVRNLLRHMYQMRNDFSILNDGMFLQQLSNQTEQIVLAGSSGVPTEFGIWSVYRGQFPGALNATTFEGASDTPVWLLYSNKNETINYQFDCSDATTDMNTTALIAPFNGGTTVKNLLYPYDEITLQNSGRTLGINGDSNPNGCTPALEMPPYGFKVYVPKAEWTGPKPMMTFFSPGHDARLHSTVSAEQTEEVDIEFQWSDQIDCDSITNSITIESTTLSGNAPRIVPGSVSCQTISGNQTTGFVGYIPSTFSYRATLGGVENGVHALTIDKLTGSSDRSTDAREKVVFRIGQEDNPVVFPLSANYSNSLVSKSGQQLMVNHKAAGASLWRYSTNWGSTFSQWMSLDTTASNIQELPWSGTSKQAWEGTHVRVEYFSPLVGQADIIQQGDLDQSPQRRWPHLHWDGPYNQYGYDAGLDNEIKLIGDSQWSYYFMSEWLPSGVVGQVNVWGMNPDKQPDQSFIFGDIDGDSVLDRLPPSSLSQVVINITSAPPKPHLGWNILINDGTMRFALIPAGNMWIQLALYIILWLVPFAAACLVVWLYMHSFYGIKFNEIGITEKISLFRVAIGRALGKDHSSNSSHGEVEEIQTYFHEKSHSLAMTKKQPVSTFIQPRNTLVPDVEAKHRTVLIATMEYNIEDWGIKVKIGGLGVMAQLMGQNLEHQDLIWVVPCVGGIDYPFTAKNAVKPMRVTILDKQYEIDVYSHQSNNITYLLLDAPVFRAQTKQEPYPARMDDIVSAIYYSAWNQCIAQAIERYPIDLYHINDYHGAVAPLYLLPRTIPCCLSLHNAEFQGLWPMRTKEEAEEVCSVFNLPVELAQKYVQFGDVFNLLHSGASILREHQNGFGAVGVSKKYGKRAFARYAIFWGLHNVKALPNPDPSDTAPWDKKLPRESDIFVDNEFEAARGELRRQAQEWAGLDQDPTAELFVFIGRWSMQKGIDLIADCFPAVLEQNPKVQLIAIGPVIDLYGKFAAAKLEKMMEVYPGRVFSRPEFTIPPPCIFSGAEFALIPSRDEPFGLVAVEFGRKGALGVGARVGGLGQMPGWWFTVESVTPAHMADQFKMAIHEALASGKETRALMRARSAKQRFPVAQWVEDLELLQLTSIQVHDKVKIMRGWEAHRSRTSMTPYSTGSATGSGIPTPLYGRSRKNLSVTALNEKLNNIVAREDQKRLSKRKPFELPQRDRTFFPGSRRGPGHSKPVQQNQVTAIEGASPEIATNLSHEDLCSSPIVPQPSRQDVMTLIDPFDLASTTVTKKRPMQDVTTIANPHDFFSPPVPSTRSPVRISVQSKPAKRDSNDTACLNTTNSMITATNNFMQGITMLVQDITTIVDHDDYTASPDTLSRRSSFDFGCKEEDEILDGEYFFDVPLAEHPLVGQVGTKKVSINSKNVSHRDTGHSLVGPRTSSYRFSAPEAPHTPSPVPSTPTTPRHEPSAKPKSTPGRAVGFAEKATLGLANVVGDKTDFNLQKVDPFFTDSGGQFYKDFNSRLVGLNGSNSDKTCIEEYLVKSEKSWFDAYRSAKLGLLRNEDSRTSLDLSSTTMLNSTTVPGSSNDISSRSQSPIRIPKPYNDEFLLGQDYKPPTGLKKFMQLRILDWPVYSILLALGQIISANSYQITLLTGEIGQSAEKLYVVASIYLATSFLWWFTFRTFPSRYTLSIPFGFYGLAFMFIGVAHFSTSFNSRGWIQNVGTGCYTVASSSGSIFFATNFGDEGGRPIKTWTMRACIIQGTQQIYVVALWAWGAYLSRRNTQGYISNPISTSWKIIAICMPIAVLFWVIGLVVFFGLPKYYYQRPGAVPSFYTSITRRKVVLWFFVSVVVSNFFLSAPYGRNWTFLFSSPRIPAWVLACLIILFFVGVWTAFLTVLGKLSKAHSWIIPMFGLGLGPVRFFQILWATSNIGLYLPWAGGTLASAVASRSLWLWLGTLDTVQGVGIGMLLLQTLTRSHVAFTLTAAQVLGSMATIIARACAPNSLGPGPISPDIGTGISALNQAWFWIGLIMNIGIYAGFAVFFRKEQLLKP